MARPSKQIGWSQEANLYYELLKQLERLTAVMSNVTLGPVTPSIPSVTIGTQIWSLRNLDVETYRNGDPIPQVTDGTEWANLTTGAWCYYLNSSANGVVYGKLYNWYAVNDPRGLAPEGWHIPTNSEWTTLSNFLGGLTIAGGAMKEAGTTNWAAPNTDATNSSGLTILPSGNRFFLAIPNQFSFLTTSGYYWSSTSLTATTAGIRWVWNTDGTLRDTAYNKKGGLAVRLVKD